MGGTFKRSAEVGTLEPNSGNGNSYYTVLNRGDLTLKSGSRVELLLADGKPAGFSSVVDNGWYSGKPEKDGYVARLTVALSTTAGIAASPRRTAMLPG